MTTIRKHVLLAALITAAGTALAPASALAATEIQECSVSEAIKAPVSTPVLPYPGCETAMVTCPGGMECRLTSTVTLVSRRGLVGKAGAYTEFGESAGNIDKSEYSAVCTGPATGCSATAVHLYARTPRTVTFRARCWAQGSELALGLQLRCRLKLDSR